MSNQTHGETVPVKSADQARQAVTGHGVRYVLFWSLGAAIVVMAIAWLVFFKA